MHNLLNKLNISKLEAKDTEHAAQLKKLARDTYRLWVRAERPPFREFFDMDLEEQTQLAEAGDAHRVAEQSRLAILIVNALEAKLASLPTPSVPIVEGAEEALDASLAEMGS